MNQRAFYITYEYNFESILFLHLFLLIYYVPYIVVYMLFSKSIQNHQATKHFHFIYKLSCCNISLMLYSVLVSVDDSIKVGFLTHISIETLYLKLKHCPKLLLFSFFHCKIETLHKIKVSIQAFCFMYTKYWIESDFCIGSFQFVRKKMKIKIFQTLIHKIVLFGCSTRFCIFNATSFVKSLST